MLKEIETIVWVDYLEFSMMDVQRYEFTCIGCNVIQSRQNLQTRNTCRACA
jgi:hypothetical protein